MSCRHVAAAAVLIAACASAPASAQELSETIRFRSGSTSLSVIGQVRGYEGARYSLDASKGQRLSVEFAPDNPSCYFNVLPPASDAAAVFTGANEGDRFSGALTETGEHTIQVYLMRNAARRNETCAYTLTVAVDP